MVGAHNAEAACSLKAVSCHTAIRLKASHQWYHMVHQSSSATSMQVWDNPDWENRNVLLSVAKEAKARVRGIVCN